MRNLLTVSIAILVIYNINNITIWVLDNENNKYPSEFMGIFILGAFLIYIKYISEHKINQYITIGGLVVFIISLFLYLFKLINQ